MTQANHKLTPAEEGINAARQDNNSPLLNGFQFGYNYRYELTRREIEELHPGYNDEQTTLFINGMLDGIKGDNYRLNMLG